MADLNRTMIELLKFNYHLSEFSRNPPKSLVIVISMLSSTARPEMPM